jgi:hypothetical protein
LDVDGIVQVGVPAPLTDRQRQEATVVVAAIARELAGFIWAIGQEMRAPMTA